MDVLDRFLTSAAAFPSAPAILEDSDTRRWTYGEMEDLVRRFAGLVARTGCRRVLICLPQGAEAYAAMLGTLLAGGSYAPVNISVPAARLLTIAGSYDPDLIVADAPGRAVLAGAWPADRLIDPAALAQEAPIGGPGTVGLTAYVIFTSGSTGTPKGVEISRAALNHYVAWTTVALDLRHGDRVSQFANIGFDLSVLEIFGALCSGAALCPFPTRGNRLMPARRIAEMGLTVWISVPSVVSLMMRAGQVTADHLSSVRLFAFCGEPLHANQVEAIFAACPDSVFLNTYGPTETTVSVTCVRLNPATLHEQVRGSVSMGTAIPGMTLHLLGGPSSDEGEVVIAGPQLAEGYWRDPEGTSRAFRTIQVNGEMVRAYFTGDWAERIGGAFYFRERMDFQVKLRGNRIELNGIAAAIQECGWPTACVVKQNERLVALLELDGARVFDEPQLRKALALKVEAYCIPEVILLVEALPRNANDKIDGKLAATLIEGHLSRAFETGVPGGEHTHSAADE